MVSGRANSPNKLIVDSVHGDIHLTPMECAVIDTASFQRLRHLKQLGMAQVTYPNATHTRFAHSIGVLGIMERITSIAREPLNLSEEAVDDIRLAGLLHDIGHFPYSHLMERIDKIKLTDEFIQPGQIDASRKPYPKHEDVGELIVTSQDDLIAAIGGKERAERVAALFTRKTTSGQQMSKLIHSSLDMDRLDYLLRDAQAAGVPYGIIDLNYLLNNFRTSPTGMLGVDQKALAAVEHFLLARFFMHKAVYYHKTTFALEEACRQLLRRVRDRGLFEIPADGDAIKKLVTGDRLGEFTDALVDGYIEKASKLPDGEDDVIKSLAKCIRNRRPPKLLKEVVVLDEINRTAHDGALFHQNCKHQLQSLAGDEQLPVGRFLVCETPPLTLEKRGSRLTEDQARNLEPEGKEEMIKVFVDDQEEPVSVVNVQHSLLRVCSNYSYQSFRLYFVPAESDAEGVVDRLRERVKDWHKS